MRKFSLRTAALALVATLFVGAAAYAADPPAAPTPEQHRQARQNWLQQKLGLTDVQAQQIRDIRARDLQGQKQTWQALSKAQGELRRLALSGADDKTLAAKQTEVQNLLAQTMQARLNTLKEIGPILSPDQREAYAKLMEQGPRGHHHTKRQG
jgi:Spy/CpxP family protein refolding chaperone